MVGWNNFESKHGNNLDKAFEDLTYHLFCYEFNERKPIFRFHNQKAIETEPINNDDECIGFQTKTFSSLSTNVQKFKDTIDDVKNEYPNLTQLIFYVYEEIGPNYANESRKPNYILGIEKYGQENGIKVEWRVRSQLEIMLSEPENILVYYLFFDDDFVGIQTLDYFINKSENKFRPDLKNDYLKIDYLHDNLLNNIENNRIISISGKQNIGKTRLSIEVSKQLSQNQDFNVIIIAFPNQKLLINLRKIIRPDKKYLLIFDNYLGNFKDLNNIVGELWNHDGKESNIKFIFTLKKQYETVLREILLDYDIFEFQMDIISDKEMRKIIGKEIKKNNLSINQSNIQKIVDISKGNVGICLMAMKLVDDDSFNYIKNYHDIYKYYFTNLKLDYLSKEDFKILGILSFFETINFDNDKVLDTIMGIFGLDLRQKIDLLEEFSYLEIVDLNKDNVYFSDSILSTYVFYLTFVDEERLCLKDLILNFIDTHFKQLNDKIFDIMNVFGKDSINKLKISQLNPIESQLSGNRLILFYIIFYIVYVDEIAIYLKGWVDSLEGDVFDRKHFKIPDKFSVIHRLPKITLLSRLFYTENQLIGLKLSINLILKKQSFAEDVLYSLKENYSYTLYDIEHDFNMQNSFLNFIESENFNENEQIVADNVFLFLLSQNRFLGFRHSQIRGTTNPNESEILDITLPISRSLMNVRLRLLEYLFKLYELYPIEVEDNFESYSKNIFKNFAPIYKNEENIVHGFLKNLNYENYKTNKIAYLYLKKMNEHSIKLENNFDFINDEIINDISVYSNILDQYSYPNFKDKVEQIANYHKKTKSYYRLIFSLMSDIKSREDRCSIYCDEYLSFLMDLNFNTFIEAFSYYMENNFRILNSFNFVVSLANHEDNHLSYYSLLDSFEYDDKNNIKYVYFKVIPQNCVNEAIFNDFVDFINLTPNNVDFLNIDKYLKFDAILHTLIDDNSSNMIQFIVKTIMDNIDETTNIFIHGFFKDNIDYFQDNFELLKAFYLKNISVENFDYDFSELQLLCEKDNDFLFEYFKYRLSNNDEFHKEHLKISFIWDFDYNFENIENLINLIIDNDRFNAFDAVNLLFSNKNSKEKEFVSYYVVNNVNNKFYIRTIFEIIKFNYSLEEYVDFLKDFLIINDDFEIFKLLMEPYFLRKLFVEKAFLESQIKFYATIRDMLIDIPKSYKYLGHKLYLSNTINEIEEKLRKTDYFG